MIDTEINVVKNTYNSLKDFAAGLGGSYTTISKLFMIPAALFIFPALIRNLAIEYIWREEQKKSGQKVSKEEIKEKYLERVSYVGIYRMQERLEKLEGLCQR